MKTVCLLSVIVPIYNVRLYLQQCLDSLVKQAQDPRIEFILIDDGSTDGSGELAQKYLAAANGRMHLFYQENQGQGSARNHGMTMARGKYIGFVDADDWIEESMFSRMLDTAEQYNADMVICNFYKVQEKGAKEYILHLQTGSQGIDPLLEKHALFECGFSVWNKIMQKSLFSDNGIAFAEGMVFEDLAIVPQLISKSHRIINTGEALYNYRVRETSTIHSDGKHVFDEFKALSILKASLSESFKDEVEYLTIAELMFAALPRYSSRLSHETYLKFYRRSMTLILQVHPNWRQNRYILKLGLSKKGYLFMLLVMHFQWPVQFASFLKNLVLKVENE